MPPTRSSKRIASGPTAQSTLSFSNKNKVTKPAPKSKSKSLFSTSTKDSDSEAPFIKKEIKTEEDEEERYVTPEVVDIKKDVKEESKVAIKEESKAAIKKEVERKERPKTEKEILAEKVGDAQVRKYWKARETERISSRVHQQDLSIEEKVLRLFDVSSQYGPAVGITRTKRWFRASKLGLEPPIEVLAVLLKEERKGNDKIERAHVDELLNSRFIIGET